MAALGYEGEATQTSTRSFLDLLREAGGRLTVLDPTIREIYRVLNRIQELIGTSAGRHELRPTPLVRHFLRSGYRPSDVAKERGLVRHNLQYELRLNIKEAPDHAPDYTDDEEALGQALADKRERGDPMRSPRVLHDVDCIAAVQTLRRGQAPARLDNARALFVSRSPEVCRNTTRWWRDQGYSGIPPAVHQLWLGSVLWLKTRRPIDAVGDYPILSLVSLCESALRPDPDVWATFLERLDSLVKDARLSEDEAVVVLCSDLTDTFLSRAQDDWGDDATPDANSIAEVIERVQSHYRAETEEKEQALRQEVASRQGLETGVRSFSLQVGRVVSWVVFVLAFVLLSLALFVAAGLLGASLTVKSIVAVALLLVGLANYSWGFNLRDARLRLEDRLRTLLESRIGAQGGD